MLTQLIIKDVSIDKKDTLFRLNNKEWAQFFSEFMNISCFDYLQLMHSTIKNHIIKEEETGKNPDEIAISTSQTIVKLLEDRFIQNCEFIVSFFKQLYNIIYTKLVDEESTCNALKTLFFIRFLIPSIKFPHVVLGVLLLFFFGYLLFIYIYIYIMIGFSSEFCK